MTKKESPLHWFKFEPSGYMFGKIQKRSKEAKVIFLELLCKYWVSRCNMSVEDAKIDLGEGEISELIHYKVVKVDGPRLRIDFLDKQFAEIQQVSVLNSGKGKLSAEARRRKAQGLNSGSTGVQPTSTGAVETNTKFFRLRDGIIRESLSEWFKRNNSIFLDQWMGKHIGKEALLKSVTETMDTNYVGYQFNNENHIQNTFKQIWEKAEKGGTKPWEKPPQTKSDKSYFKKK